MTAIDTARRFAFGPYRLVPEQRLLTGPDGQPIALRGKSFDLLWYLVQHRGRLVEKAEIFDALWPNTVVEENNLSQTVSALRQALQDDPKNPRYLATVKGRGFQFVGDVRETDEAAPQGTNRAMFVVALTGLVLAVLAVGWWNRDSPPTDTGTPVVEHFSVATLRLVTDIEGSHSAPALSPDGSMMAYVSDTSGTPQIWVKNLERGEPIQITDGPYAASSPSWSPKGDQIIFSRTGPDGVSIFSVGTLGDPGPQMIVEHATSPSYALHEDAFVYTTNNRIWVARNDGRDREPVLGLPQSQGFARRTPALSPDGQFVAFVHADEGPLGNLWIIPAAGGEARQLTTPDTTGGIVTAPAWSSDGRYIVYTVNAETGGSQLWRVAVESGEAVALTSGPGGADEAIISMDGTRMAYESTRTLWTLNRIDPLTRERSAFLTMRSPIILPVASNDNSTIVFFSQLPSGRHIFTVDTDGKNLRQRTFDEPGNNDLPTWHGDGESLLYYRDQSLRRLNLASGADTQVFTDFHWSTKNWMDAHGDRITYHNVDRVARQRSTVIRAFGESSELELPVPLQAAQWSPDGNEVVGYFARTGEVLICDDDAASCEHILVDGAPLRGTRPMWSLDGLAIYYLRWPESGNCCALWRVNRDGSDNRLYAELPNFSFANSHYDLDADGRIFYSHLDNSADEIWLAETGR